MPTILLVDDDLNLLSSVATMLEDAHYTVLRASRLEQAGRMVATEALDLVLLEVGMDHGRGWDLLREIVEVRHVPVIVLSDHGLEEDIVAALDIGAVDFLAKPFRSHELQARIRRRIRHDAAIDHVAAAFTPMPQPLSTPPSAFNDVPDQVREAPVFMDPAAEHRLLQERPPAEVYTGDVEELSLGARLRAARQRRNLSLVQVELDTKLRIWYVQAMEEGRFGLLPRSNNAETMLREYARYLDLDVDHALSDFRTAYADAPAQPIAYLGGSPEPREIPQWLIMGAAAVLALVLGLGGINFLLPDQVDALGANLRVLVNPPTSTPLPTQTPFPTLTPTRTPVPTLTATTQPTPTIAPTATATPELSVTTTAGPP